MPLRVAAAQFATGMDADENLAACLRAIDAAGRANVELVVLPEFCNQLSWYDDHEQAWAGALDLSGPFLAAVAAAARRHRLHVVINVALRRAAPRITVTSLLYGADGGLLAQADKQTLMGHENTWFARAEQVGPVVPLPFGRIGLFPCRDGVTCETARGLTLRGAQLFCDSLNSFAFDEASLHVPARAVENKAWMVAANKIGPLVPAPLLEQISAATAIPIANLHGAGESQIVAPDGRVLARASRDREELAVAEIDIALADDKRRPDGTDLFRARRPELYGELAVPARPPAPRAAAEEMMVALLCPRARGEAALAGLRGLIDALPATVRFAVLPELALLDADATGAPEQARRQSLRVLTALQGLLLDRGLLVCTTVVEPAGDGLQHVGVLVGAGGVVARQPQLHAAARHRWASLGHELRLFDLPQARVAMLVGDDSVHPELARCAALRGAQLLLAPIAVQEPWETELGLLSRAAENRVCVAAASYPNDAGTGLVATLEREFTLLTTWRERRFDGFINQPLVTRQQGPVTLAAVHPAAANNKLMSSRTDLLADRPWRLSGGLVGAAES